MNILDDLLIAFRRSIVLLAIENCGIRESLLKGYSKPDIPQSTTDKVVLAAAALGMLDAENLQWKEPFRPIALDATEWKRILALIHHQHSYLDLASCVNSSVEGEDISPLKQLESEPTEYLAFLQGVDASHWEHAKWFAGHAKFVASKRLVDLGGGLGTFSRAWIQHNKGRNATVVDFPRVEHLLPTPILENDISFYGADLRKLKSLPTGDVYLAANVLHLLPDWEKTLGTVVDLMPKSAQVCIIEANPEGNAGRLFDLQVHLRSGGVGGLLTPSVIKSALLRLRLSDITQHEFHDAKDPFKRRYNLWSATKLA